MASTYLALGSNLGIRVGYLRGAVRSLPGPLRCSRVYETDPVQAPAGSRPFLNAVVEIDFSADTGALLGLVNRLESQANRIRTQVNGPRTLDVDVIYVEGMVTSNSEMTVPHPRCSERAFVIAPLMDLEPQLARRLSPEMAADIQQAFDKGLSEVYQGVRIYGGLLC
ncbi:MAG: 2-amino-4-hydroxy-6-hydroxymethyldihydropteridine diphosphokinase [Actinomycetota bacterium]|nr:MAG: 2-amino-4-hydroxy-6-hydroxymethyldihydropteridine diphosphokinase [Actinomycetota bacterium]